MRTLSIFSLLTVGLFASGAAHADPTPAEEPATEAPAEKDEAPPEEEASEEESTEETETKRRTRAISIDEEGVNEDEPE